MVPFKRVLFRLVRPDPGSRTGNAYVLGARSLAAVRAFEKKSRRSEAVHLLGLVTAAAVLAIAAAERSGLLALPGAVVFLLNFHCFILQRYNRSRAYRLLDRAAQRAAPSRTREGTP